MTGTTTVTQGLEVAKGITDYGLMVVIAAFFLLLSAGMMVALFRWFKELVNSRQETETEALKQQTENIQQVFTAIEKLCLQITPIAESVKSETKSRVQSVAELAFQLNIEQVCRLIKRVRKENHIANRENTAAKVRKSLKVLYEERSKYFDSFTYCGHPLSDYTSEDWIEQVAQTVETELYHEDGENNARAYTNVKLAYDTIRADFYNRLDK